MVIIFKTGMRHRFFEQFAVGNFPQRLYFFSRGGQHGAALSQRFYRECENFQAFRPSFKRGKTGNTEIQQQQREDYFDRI